MKYLATKNEINYHSDSLYQLAFMIFHIKMNQHGQVMINNAPDTISYNMDYYTQQEALLDFANTRALTILKRHGYTIYKQIDP